MKRRIARHKRTLALLLTLCLLLTCLPLQAMSAGGTAEETDISNEVYIVDEDITKRGEYEKHFLCSDGTYRAVTYAEPVHYYDSSTGTWQDNDVALTLNAASTRYEAQSGSFAVSFAKSYAAPALSAAANGTTQSQATQTAQTVTMSNGIYPISWTTAVKPELSVAEGTAIQKSAALGAPRLLTRTPAASILTSAEAEAAQSFAGKPISDSGSFAAANRISVAEYGNIAQTAGQSAGVSLRYSVSQHKIKEDIVISNKSAVTDFVTTLDVGALTAVKQEDGSVLLVDEYGDTAYTVGVPFMYDADYNVSYNVAVTVGQTGSVCRITYAPDREWLNAAVYPVVLDPTVTSSEYYANIVDTYVTQADSNNHSGEGNLVVGIKNGKLNRAYLRINNLPAIPAGVTPASAQLLIKHGANTTSGRAMTLYRVNSSWSPGSITYSNQPSASTSIGSCAFNTSNVRFTFSQSQIQDLYTRVSNNTNYGFQIRYTSESTTNPDYNMLRSMEYPTASEQPAFTVTYAYTLPESLSVWEIYLFRNAGSGKYMDVQNGTDANDTNVIQWGWNGSLAQQFKLEQSSTGNGYILRSQVGGKTRVLDIYKTNGRRVENGNNVQIYRNVDPKAQEWLILPVDADNFRIVPRSNMSLSLTSYGSANGTANGRTSTSAGNVFVSTYTGADNQLWEIYKTDRTQVKNDIGTVPSGTYYVNNRDTGGYLKRSGTSLSAQAGVILKNTVKTPYQWRITEVNDNQYTIQPANDLTKYLSAAPSTSSVSLSDFPTYWNARYGNNGGAIFTVTSSGKNYALAVVSGTVKLQTLSSTTGTSTYNRQVWSLPKTVDYKELTDYTVADMNISVDQSQSPSIIKTPSNAECSLAADFSYTVINGTTEFLSVVNGNQLKGLKQGMATVRAKHKPSGIEREFRVAVVGKAVELETGIYNIKNLMTDKYLTVDGGIAENNRNVLTSDYNGSTSQKWKIERQSDGTYKIMTDLHNHYNLDVTNGVDADGTNVQICGSNDSSAQRWRIFENEDGTYTIQPVLSKLNVLGSTVGANAYLRQYTAGESQKWIIHKAIEPEAYNAGVRIAYIEGEYLYDYTIPINRLFEEAAVLCEERRCMNWTQYCEWCLDNNFYNPSMSQHLGMQAGSFIWFLQQVRSGAVWDVKNKDRWMEALPNVPYLGLLEEFAFRGETCTAEALGNIFYGYTGTAIGFSPVTLYWGGGVARLQSISSDELRTPPTYGDDENDHINIEKGINLFHQNHPNYPEAGFEGIPFDVDLDSKDEIMELFKKLSI